MKSQWLTLLSKLFGLAGSVLSNSVLSSEGVCVISPGKFSSNFPLMGPGGLLELGGTENNTTKLIDKRYFEFDFIKHNILSLRTNYVT